MKKFREVRSFDVKKSFFYGAMGAAGGFSGVVTMTRCSGGNCTACFWCAGVGIAAVLAALCSNAFPGKEDNDGNN